MRKLFADTIHTGDCGFIDGHVIVLDSDGTILDLKPYSDFDLKDCEYLPGALLPGFINAHCHLELSHLKGQFQTGTKLIPFLKSVVQNRETNEEFILESIKNADEQMYREGIVAVGDISNKTDTIQTKAKSKIYYHTFIEAFDFLQEQMADKFFDSYKTVYNAFRDLPKSMVPHAPYSVSKRMFQLINETNLKHSSLSSIHNQETSEEDLLFQNKSGAFIEFWNSFGFKLDDFNAIRKDSVYYALENMESSNNTLFIHNIQMKAKHIQDVLSWNPNSFFVTCPNANLYIENSLPEYAPFLNQNAKLCIGTDSLCSNWQLSILEEIKTILKYNSYLILEEVIKWSTHHSALALKLDSQLGSLSKGKRPGINWIQSVEKINDSWDLGIDAKVKRII